ncbi:MAG: glycosyltransferase family 1 protein [Candidatus Curtissbacteria bacterium]|nr:glycosyltransferase family 1 protein [Candidatus Curtissbacteria bacterium]
MLIGVDGNEANVKNRVGSGQYTFELLKQFALLSRHPEPIRPEGSRPRRLVSGSDLKFVIYLKDKPLPDFPKNLDYKVFGPKKFWTQFALPLNLTFGQKPDVFLSPAHYGPRFSRVPYIVTIHDLSYLHFPELFKKNDLYQLTSWSKYSIENSAHIIAVSQSTKDDIIKNYDVQPSKITVTYEGYDKGRFKPQPRNAIDKIKKKYKIAGDYVIFVGTLQPRKNIERLIKAFASVNCQPSTDNLSLVVVGKKGWMYDEILKKSEVLGIEKKVIFTDFVPDEDLPALISGAKIYVNPSLWEGFGIPVIEAQACGVPVVVSNTSSLPEIVGESGLLVDPASVDSIARGIGKVISDKKLRDKLVEKGFQNIKRFSWENCAAETLKVLERANSKL